MGHIVDEDGAGASLAAVAGPFRSREVELLAQDVEQGVTLLDIDRARLPVYLEVEVGERGVGHGREDSARRRGCKARGGWHGSGRRPRPSTGSGLNGIARDHVADEGPY